MVTAAQAQRQQQYRAALQNENVQRALATVRAAEGTAQYANPYGTEFGGTQFNDYSQHPGLAPTGFTDSTGRRQRSSAAGAYQMLGRTWNGIQNRLGLTDFSPENQDIAAVGLMDQRGALPSVYAGDVPGFASRVRNEWASMPNSPYGQPTQRMSTLQNAWNNYTPQAQQTTGIMSAINPATVGAVERGLLSAPVSPTNVPGINATPDLSSFVGPQPTPGYVDPQVTTAYQKTPQMTPATQAVTQQAQPASIDTAAVQAPTAAQRGLLSPSEYGAFQQQKASLDNAAPNTSFNSAHVGQVAQKALGAIAGGLLGGVALGPIGGLLGGYIGKQIASPNGLFGNNNFPTKPDSKPKGDGSMTAYGKSVASSSGQFSGAMSKGGIGLY